MKANEIEFYEKKNEETRILPDIEIHENKQRSKKRKKVDDKAIDTQDFDIKRQRLNPRVTSLDLPFISNSLINPEEMTEDKSDEEYDVLCDYLNILIPDLEWRVNKEKTFPKYEVINLTKRRLK